jgi:hemerythrin-like domain-containing protein
MNDPMTILKADHREAKKLLNKLAESEEGNERQKMAKELEKALTLHMQLEEMLVYPLVKKDVGAEDEEEAQIEHQLARDGLQKMMSLVSMPGFGAAVEMLLGGIEHHVEEEEGELLPELKSALGREEWLALGDSIAQAKADAGMPVPKPRQTTRRSAKRKRPAMSR